MPAMARSLRSSRKRPCEEEEASCSVSASHVMRVCRRGADMGTASQSARTSRDHSSQIAGDTAPRSTRVTRSRPQTPCALTSVPPAPTWVPPRAPGPTCGRMTMCASRRYRMVAPSCGRSKNSSLTLAPNHKAPKQSTAVGSGMLLRAAARKLPQPCRYASSGCTESVLPTDMEKHASTCDFRPHHCPLSSNNCHWKGDMDDIVDHLLKSHPDVNHSRGPITKITLNNLRQVPPAEWMSLQTCLGQNFLVSVQKLIRDGHPQFFGTVKVIGSKECASRFEYKIGLNKIDSLRRVTYSTIVGDISSGSQAINDKDCLVFDGAYLDLFSVNDTIVIDVSLVMKS